MEKLPPLENLNRWLKEADNDQLLELGDKVSSMSQDQISENYRYEIAGECMRRNDDDLFATSFEILKNIRTRRSTELLLSSIHEDSLNTYDILLMCELAERDEFVSPDVFVTFLDEQKSPLVRQTASRILSNWSQGLPDESVISNLFQKEEDLVVKVNLAGVLCATNEAQKYRQFLTTMRTYPDVEVAREARRVLDF